MTSINAAPKMSYATALAAANASRAPSSSFEQKAATVGQNFESVFLNSMFQQMLTSVGGDGPFGGGGAGGVWRSLLGDEYAKSFAKGGGVGIGAQVYQSLLKAQEAANP
ncbi:MAG: rod-binding protein [Rhizobiales bacterium]|nr:rod-binding protein [Hyphomicrobiales bacterium]